MGCTNTLFLLLLGGIYFFYPSLIEIEGFWFSFIAIWLCFFISWVLFGDIAETIITSEGGQTPSRFKHIIMDPKKNEYRTLTPDEVEKICGFPAGWTNTGMPDNWRYFCMGNALVVGLIEKMGKTLLT